MSEPITFDPLGTITVTIKDQTYTLDLPDFGPWRRLHRSWADASREAYGQLTDRNAKIAVVQERLEFAKTAAQKKKVQAEIAELNKEIAEFEYKQLYEWQVPWLRGVFAELGDKPLPAEEDDWPAWLATDSSIPKKITDHWQTHPKVSGDPSN